MSEQNSGSSTPNPRPTVRPLSGASSARLASLRSSPAPFLPVFAPKPAAEASQGDPGPTQSPEPRVVEPVQVSTRELLAKARQQSQQSSAPSSGAKVKTMVSSSKQHSRASTPWRTPSPVKTEEESRFDAVAFGGSRGGYRPQALPIGRTAEKKLEEGKLLLVQFPPVLPTLRCQWDKFLPPEDRKVGTKLEDMPDGTIGELRIHASGKMSMMIGNIEFDVSEGCTQGCRQEAAFISRENEEILFLGPVDRKLVVTPKLDADDSTVKMEID